MIVDAHVHLVSDDRSRYPQVPGYTGRTTQVTNPVDELLAFMDSAGVDRVVAVQTAAYAYDNSYHADSAARFPGRVAAVCLVDPVAPDAADRLTYWTSERGMQGIRIWVAGFPGQQAVEVDDPRNIMLWERAQTLGVPILLLGGGQRDRFEKMRAMVARFAGVTVVLDHMSGWSGAATPRHEVTEGLLALAALPNVYLKVSTANLEPHEHLDASEKDLFRRILDAFTPQRMMWGSDYPNHVGLYGDMVELGRTALPWLSESDRSWMLGETAAAVWPSLKG